MADGTLCLWHGIFRCSKGSGEDREEFYLRVFRDVDDVESLLLEEEGKWTLFRRPQCPPTRIEIVTLHESFAADFISRDGKRVEPKELRWVTLETPFQDEAAPFEETREALLWGDAPDDVWMSVALMEWTDGVFCSSSRAASEIEPGQVPLFKALDARVLEVFGWGLVLLFGVSAWSGNTAPVTALWWLGPIALFIRPLWSSLGVFFEQCCRLLSGLFFFHLLTHGIDNFFTQDWDNEHLRLFESARLCLTLALLMLARRFAPRVHFAILDGVPLLGCGSWLIFGFLLATYLEDPEETYQWFSWYIGEPPQSLLFALLAVVGIAYKWKDYRKVPLDLLSFRSSLYRSAEVLEGGLASVGQSQERLQLWADDLADALEISLDPRVNSLRALKENLRAWRDHVGELCAVLADGASDEQLEAVERDIKTIQGDLFALCDGLEQLKAGQPATFFPIRRSPLAATWNH